MRQWIEIEKIPEVLAPSYEKAARLVVESFYRKIADEIFSSFKAGLLLDLGTGPGYLPIEIAKRSPKINIVGIDLCEKLIHTARANAANACLSSQLCFEIGSAARLRFQEASFDMVISTGMLHSLKDPVKVFKEIHRLLKKDATAWILDPASVASLINREEWWASLSFRDRFFLRLFRALGLHQPVKPYTRNQITPIIEAAGFRRYAIEEAADEIRIVLEK
jgi:ubiquinone/menaquinone biosynthesis C-methylase UbiE